MVTDCIQGIICGLGFLVLSAFLLMQYPWQDIVQAMQDAPIRATQDDLVRDADLKKLAYDEAVRQGMTDVAEERLQENERLLETARDPSKLREEAAGKSMFNPFDTGRVKHFSMAFYLILIFNIFYGAMSWQGSQAYQSSGKSPHEQKMALIIIPWVYAVRFSGLILIAVCALTFLTHPNFAAVSADAHSVIDSLKASDSPQLAIQQRVPIALSYMLPTGLRGFFCMMMVFLLITTQDTYMHSWGSIFVQDIVLPLRKNRLSPEQHVKWLRGSVIGVAIFAVIFAALYKPTEFIQMYFAITGAILSGLGCVIVGGLYWRTGGTIAAYVAVGLGALLSTARIVLQQFTEQITAIPDKGSILRLVDYLNTQTTSQIIWFWIMMICIGAYVVLSLMSRHKPFNLEQMLHRGQYDTEREHQEATETNKTTWLTKLGIGKEFTRNDWLLVLALVIWNSIWVATFVIATIVNYFVSPISIEWWTDFWRLWIYTQLAVGIPAMIWFTVGGLRDIRTVFQRLSTLKRDETDDGWIERESSS